MGGSGKSSTISSVIAAVCIFVYVAAVAFGAIRIAINMGERRNLARMEFNFLGEMAVSGAAALGFMSVSYQEAVREFLRSSRTPLLGVIITGPSGEHAFEREPGSGIHWSGNNPRLRTGFGYPGKPMHMPLRIEGQRNVNIYAVYSHIDYDFFFDVLRKALLAVLAALAVALITLLIELIIKYRNASISYEGAKPDPAFKESFEESGKEENSPEVPRGLFTPRGNIGWGSYISERLNSELHRCSSAGQDLTLLNLELTEEDDHLYRRIAEEAVNFFSMRDLVFEKDEKGISVIIPGLDLDSAMEKTEEFLSAIAGKTRLRAGLSSRSGRLVEAGRLMLEAGTALEKAVAADKIPAEYVTPAAPHPIIAFKSDLEKYCEFIRRK